LGHAGILSYEAEMRFGSALARSAILALVSAALAALVTLAIGDVTYGIRVAMGSVSPQTGFEPNNFLRTVGLPAAGLVFVVVLTGSMVKLRRS
jgi:hypothetical protein